MSEGEIVVEGGEVGMLGEYTGDIMGMGTGGG